MSADVSDWGGLPAGFLTPGPPSFLDFLTRHAPDALPGTADIGAAGGAAGIPHGTTIVAATYADGVLLAGDRRITQGNLIAHREAEKVFPTDEYSAVGISGTVGLAVEMVRLFQLELEHYEKVEGVPLSLVGKANRLTAMVRGNLGMAMQGLAVIPLFVGYDLAAGRGRIFSFEPAGAHSEERDFAATGSGSPFARGALKKLYRPGLDAHDLTHAVIQALYDAAEEDTATGGPDPTRGLYPVVTFITRDGYHRLPDEETAEAARAVVEQRRDRPDGPWTAAL
ncbi:proteasome subunit beta [Streptomyces johnsoniae]|uniref:Proteasome subunit beta n=1 Tax=Streptomyces johnsoniae TaxID=3075532 RepID=A0ABU2S0P7_9ACTN|nr:proteasome subunit beta [Streptomyces sp. DSM 41886]MDT0442353.1 proteasome subunit beta [Streptomyces sp. DSM 41886]